MRLTEIVRIGGRLALLAGFAVFSLASANSISYFYGYSSPSLASWQTVDPFASQNVQFVPQVSMVSSGVGPSSPWGVTYGNMAGSGSNVAVNTTTNDAIYGAWEYNSASLNLQPSSSGSNPFGGGYSSYGSNVSTSNQSSYGGNGGYFVPTSSYSNVNNFASWNAWQMPSSGGGGMSDAPQLVAWQPIRDSALPPVSSNFTSPTVLPEIVPPSSNVQPGSVLDSAFGTPEPASIGLMAAGLVGLLYLRRRRC